MKRVSTRAEALPRSPIREMFDLAAQYEGVINFGIGEPHLHTDRMIADRAYRDSLAGHTHYTANAGDPELRRALAEKLRRENGIDADPRGEIVVTTGAMEALYLAILCITDPGDEILVADPGWVNYSNQISLTGVTPVPVPVTQETGFVLQPADLEQRCTPRTRAVILNTPANPTGTVYSREELDAIGEFARSRDLLVICDEVYERLLYGDARHHSLAANTDYRDRCITIFSFSKAYAMCGWRVGYAVGPEEIIRQMTKVHENVSACAPSISQRAAIHALQEDRFTHSMLDVYSVNRKLVVETLREIPGVTCVEPRGTFYAFPAIDLDAVAGSRAGQSAGGTAGGPHRTSRELALEILRRERLVTVPGSAFGARGEGYLRLSFASQTEVVEEGLRRLRRCLMG